jgi:hypothetical protein
VTENKDDDATRNDFDLGKKEEPIPENDDEDYGEEDSKDTNCSTAEKNKENNVEKKSIAGTKKSSVQPA